jgi:hypothetical protein
MKPIRCFFLTISFIFILACPGSIFAQTPEQPSGTGTSEDPYLIATLNNLYWVTQNSGSWDKHFEQTAIIDASGTSGWWGGTGFSPIGNFNTSFTGTYNGNSHAITNMYIYRPNENQPQGLFGYTENATLFSINNESVNITGFHGVGAIVGYAYLTNISFCYSSGNVTADGDNLGGIAGENMEGMVEHCTSDCNVTATSSDSDRVGGLVGYNLYGSAVIIDSKSRGNVNGYSYTGGLVGDNWGGQINSSKSTSSVTGTNYVGGLIGYTKNAGNIKNSYCRGDVTRKSSSTETNIGGYCGYNENSTIQFSYSTGSVYYDGTAVPTDKGFMGGDNGSADVIYSANFFDSQVSNQTTATGATASNTIAMTDATIYANAGWDGTIWFIDASNDGYVHLEFEDWGGQSIAWGIAEVSTDETSNIGTTTAQSGGNVTDEGNSYVTSKGVVWDVTDNPTILSYLGITNDGSGTGSFTSNLSGLSEATTYYVRAYATNNEGTGYGTVKSFTTDIDPPTPMTPPGNALDFDGYDDYVSLPNESNFDFTSTITIEVWLNVDAFDKDWQAIVTKGDGAWRLHRYGATNHIAFGTSGLSNVDLEGTTDVNDGQWHHVAGVFDGSTKYLFVDGNLDASVGATGSITANDYLVNIAENAESTGRYFNGLIDEVRIWNIARTQTQIQDNMNTVMTGNESGLVAYYKFDQSDSPYLWDYTGNDNLGSLNNMDNADWVTSGWNPGFDVTWTGSTDSDWTNSGNWDGDSETPDYNDDVVIPVNSNDPAIGTAVQINNLTINSGASLTVAHNGSLTVDGLLNNASGVNGLLIESTAVGTGSLISATNGVPATVQRYINGSSAWHLVSSPVTDATAEAFSGHYLQFFTEATADWTDIVEPATTLTAAQGYALWSGEETYTFEGNLNSGDVSIVTTKLYEDPDDNVFYGWNLVGNPYPSSIDWAQLDDTWGAVYYYTGTTYATWNNGAQTNDGTQYVAPGQGFFISSDGSDFELTNAMRTHEGTSDFFKNGTANDQMLLLQVSNAQGSDEACIRFNAEASDNFDRQFDAWKIMAGTDNTGQLYTFADNGILSIDTRPACNTVQLGFSSNASGQFSFTLAEIKNIPDATLEDTKTGKRTNLREKPCTFHWEPGDDEMRFKLHLNAVGIDESQISENGILIYAADGRIYVQIGNGVETHGRASIQYVTVSDMMGRIAWQQEIPEGDLVAVPVNLQTGVYLVTVQNGSEIKTEKVFIE